MFTTQWSTSERKYDVSVDRDVKVRMPDGTLLDGNIYRPASNDKFPVILGAHGYDKDLQSPPLLPVGFTPMRGYMESGDSTFYARRGYVHAVFNVRGTGRSEGFYQLMGPPRSPGHLPRDRLAGAAALERRRGRHVRRLLFRAARQGGRGGRTEAVEGDFFAVRWHR